MLPYSLHGQYLWACGESSVRGVAGCVCAWSEFVAHLQQSTKLRPAVLLSSLRRASINLGQVQVSSPTRGLGRWVPQVPAGPWTMGRAKSWTHADSEAALSGGLWTMGCNSGVTTSYLAHAPTCAQFPSGMTSPPAVPAFHRFPLQVGSGGAINIVFWLPRC